MELDRRDDRVDLRITLAEHPGRSADGVVTTERLGKAAISGQPYEDADGAPLHLDTDYFGQKRSPTNPTPGPFENPGTGLLILKVR